MTRLDPTPVDAEPPCREDPELFFTDGGRNEQRIARAKAICWKRCDFLDKCLTYALAHSVEGIWAGTEEGERKIIRARLGMVPESIVPGVPRSHYGNYARRPA